jgi:Tfp pilus assembly protein PilX
MPVEVVVNDYPGLTGLLAAVVVVLVVGTLVRLSQAICICWMERKTSNARDAAASVNVMCFPLL